jgi:signal transduction histidine kinase
MADTGPGLARLFSAGLMPVFEAATILVVVDVMEPRVSGPDRRKLTCALVVAASLGILIIDLLTPLGSAEWLFYIVILLFAGRTCRPAELYLFTLLCAILVVLGYVFTPEKGIDPGIALTNRIAVIAVMWVTSVLLVKIKGVGDRLARARGELDSKSRETAELSRDKQNLLTEIEARKLIEQQRSDFFAMVTHDLKTPLTTISGYLELFTDRKRDSLDDESLVYIQTIEKSLERLRTMVDEFLDLSRLETGAVVLNKEAKDVPPLLEDIVSGFKKATADKEITLELETVMPLPKVSMDRAYVERAVTNLLANAVNYAAARGAILVGASVMDKGSGRFMEITVADDGPGIPKDEQTKVFEKFHRVKGTGRSGSGLGLAIVRSVAEAHGGRVELESEPGKGCVFRMLLPL